MVENGVLIIEAISSSATIILVDPFFGFFGQKHVKPATASNVTGNYF